MSGRGTLNAGRVVLPASMILAAAAAKQTRTRCIDSCVGHLINGARPG